MPKVIEDKLKKEADKKGMKGDRKLKYVYGTMKNIEKSKGDKKSDKGVKEGSKKDEKKDEELAKKKKKPEMKGMAMSPYSHAASLM